MARRIPDDDRAAPRHAEQGEAFEARCVDDGFEVR
jgi:hypothetical protein